MYTYSQKTGELRQGGKLLGRGYSGHGEGRNNPAAQHLRSVGPLPRGRWRIVGPPFDGHGPYVLRLQPAEGTETFGRSGFLVHGDSLSKPGTASLGCIVLARALRVKVWESGIRDLEVVE